ncbi:hypothetical protein G8759_31180 [Spirosoma aureum]|uniref:Uncharacterized protein n=1 Tax=Spirosoma aureum TaxID=2692134 RepID=A0A6G9AWE0_9BACT|nr:hypothetical protein [Spirosoma aureum]QIP16787.1 hypothetical protein G8759_31180 [Spirosoma aureum]
MDAKFPILKARLTILATCTVATSADVAPDVKDLWSEVYQLVDELEAEANPDNAYLAKLNDLQAQIGYNPGPINLIALLGLMGEAGEVLGETRPETDSTIQEDDRNQVIALAVDITRAIDAAYTLDSRKKYFRNRVMAAPVSIATKDEDETVFNKELADAFYYVLALARNRSLTINDLARMSYEKVQAKFMNTPR